MLQAILLLGTIELYNCNIQAETILCSYRIIEKKEQVQEIKKPVQIIKQAPAKPANTPKKRGGVSA